MAWKITQNDQWESPYGVVAKNDNGSFSAWLSWNFRQKHLLKIHNIGPFKDLGTAKTEIHKLAQKYDPKV